MTKVMGQRSKGTIVVVSGPSGVGKSTICNELVKKVKNCYLSVSVTTRKKSDTETDGKDYWFVSEEEFKRRIEKGSFLEHAEVFGNFYGTPKDKVNEAIAAGKVVILEIDVQGGSKVKAIYPDAVMIFILAPTQKDLAGRLFGRGREDEETAGHRLSYADIEIAAGWQGYDNMVINANLQDAVAEIVGIIDKAGMTKKGIEANKN